MARIHKYIVLLTILFACQARGQQITSTNFHKYSYRIETIDSKYSRGNYVDNGTASILSVRKRLYLVTNYHLLLTRNALTGEYLVDPDFIPDTVRVYFHTKPNETRIVAQSYPLYDSNGAPQFLTMMLDATKYCDISVLPITDIPDTLALYIINDSIFDSTSVSAWPNKKLLFAGFPLANGDSNGYGRVFTANSIMPPGGISPYLFYDTQTEHGMSGSPIFITDEQAGVLKLIAINAEGPPIGYSPFEYGGGGIYLKYALEIIGGRAVPVK